MPFASYDNPADILFIISTSLLRFQMNRCSLDVIRLYEWHFCNSTDVLLVVINCKQLAKISF